MTPAARFSAAIEVLDQVLAGTVAEKALTSWARSHRFAGSKDRAAIRDHVFDVLRAKRSLAGLGGGATARQLILGLLRREGLAPDGVFGAGGYGPAALTDAELTSEVAPLSQAAACDIPEWLWPKWQDSLGDDAVPAATAQQSRAPVFLRINTRRCDRAEAIARLAADGIVAHRHPDVKTALEVVENARRIKTSAAFLEGYVDLQDAASQAAMLALNPQNGARVLDYCAGGGGKALALADLYDVGVVAHDISVARMTDIPQRAARAGVDVTVTGPKELRPDARFDLVLCDAPCSGSGTWRRTPDAKWRLTPDQLIDYTLLQADVLAAAAQHVRPGGTLAYATCSVLACENEAVIAAFLAANQGWTRQQTLNLIPSAKNDGFFLVVSIKVDTTLR